MKKLLLFLCAVFLFFSFGNAFALTFSGNYVIENGGTTFLLPSGESAALIGLVEDDSPFELTRNDILADVISGASGILGFFNGSAQDNGFYAPETDTFDPFYLFAATSVDRVSDSRVFDVFWMVYEDSSVVFGQNVGGGTSTAGLGTEQLDRNPFKTPEASTMFLLGFGLIGLAGFSKRRFKK